MVGIILLNYNSWNDLATCINSIELSSINLPYRIYVIDNASTRTCNDELLNTILSTKNLKFIRSHKNRGYAAGNNIGIAEALKDNCDSIIICNTDVIFNNGAVDGMYERLFSEEDLGIIGPQIIYKNQPQHITRYCKTGMRQKFFATTFLRKLFPKVEREYYGLDLDENDERYAHDVSGCCFMVKNTCACEIMPMDEHTFLFEEELIIGEKCREKNFKVLYYPFVNVIHNHSGSTMTAAAFSYTKGTRSEIYYCREYLNCNTLQILPLYLIRVLSYIGRMRKNKDYRLNFFQYLRETVKAFNISVEEFNP